LSFTIDRAGSRYVHKGGVVPYGEFLLSDKVRPKDFVSGYEFLYMGRWIDICDVDWLDLPQVAATVRKGRPSWKPTEVDFGCWWTDKGDPHGPYWRVTWNAARHELYAVRRVGRNKEHVILGHFVEKQQVEDAMEGWANPASPIYQNLAALKQHLGVDGRNSRLLMEARS